MFKQLVLMEVKKYIKWLGKQKIQQTELLHVELKESIKLRNIFSGGKGSLKRKIKIKAYF